MKRIIEGATYNTDTATLIASGRADNDPQVVDTALYQNRAGMFFAVDTITVSYKDRGGEWKKRADHEWTVVGDAAKARAFCEQYALDIMSDLDDMPPEAEPGEKLATLYVRLPPALKNAIDEGASEQKVSSNVFAMRCLERCVIDAYSKPMSALGEIFWISATFREFKKDGNWSRELAIEALSSIAHLSEKVASQILGVPNAMDEITSRLGDSLEFEEINRKYDPHIDGN